jgi:uncharacterized protein (TIGR03437 family)
MRFRLLVLSLACIPGAFAPAPSITAGGVVSAASWSSPIAPGEIVAIFGANLSAGQASANPPYPNTLGGTSVTINGVTAPVAFVSPGQINAQVPSSLATANSYIGAVSVVVTTLAGSSAPELAGLTTGAPGLFTADGSGCGQAAALNVRPDGTVSLNSHANSAAPGDYIALFGTGFGTAAQQPPDGAAPASPSQLQTAPKIFVDGKSVDSLAYQGLAPGLVGVDQINFQMPASTRNGCSVPVSASQTLGSPSVTISVQDGRGQCGDPPIQSWGQISLAALNFSGPGTVNDAFGASFPAGPNVQPPASEAIVYAPDWVGNVGQSGSVSVSAVPIKQRACSVPGYSNLSAGVIQIQPPSGSAITLQPLPLQSGGVAYSASLPTGFIGPGTYAISGTPGNDVSLNAKLVVGSPIQIQTSFTLGTVISSSQPLTVKWTGGDLGSLVRVALYSGTTHDYSYADATSGSLTISPGCIGYFGSSLACSFGLPLASGAQITVQVVPNPASVTKIAVPGITGSVQLTWQYSYNFPGLVLGQ